MVALTLLCLAGFAQPAGGEEQEPGGSGVGIQLLDAPVSRRDDPRALRYIVDHLAPGTVIHRRVLVANNSGAVRHVELYPGPAKIERGRFVFGADDDGNELTSWTSLEPSALDLAPGGKAQVVVTISVPPAASAGERYAVVWAAVASEPAPTGNVRQVSRVGVRVYLDVGPGGEPPSSFEFGRLTAARDAHGRPVVTVEVTNTGARAVDLSGTAMLTDGPAGTRAGPFDVEAGTTLARGQSGTVTVRFPRELPDGPWTVVVKLESGTVRNSMTARINFAGGIGEAPAGSAVPWLPIVGAVLGLALFMAVALVLRARRRVPPRHRTPRAQSTA